MTPMQIQRIAQSVVLSCEQLGRSPSVEEVQDMVEHQIMAHGAFEVAKAISPIAIPAHWYASPTPQTTRF